MSIFKKSSVLITALLLSTSPVFADGHKKTASSDSIHALVDDGKFFGHIRYRYENVDEDGIAEEANANTVRINAGFETGNYLGLHALAELQLVQQLGSEDFNSLANTPSGTFPTVADPDVQQINRFWLGYNGIPDTNIKVGRQFINLDNQRFVGTVGWRQNDQTFDSATITNNSIEGLTAQYSFLNDVNRIFGDDAPPENLDSTVHLLNVSYDVADWLKLTGYGYWLDFDNAATLSSRTYGLRAKGKAPIGSGWNFIYEAEAATQEDHGNNTASYDEEYYHVSPGIKGHGFIFKLGYEVLGGDGTNSFQTPLATGHKFNGWADKFLTTPDQGLEDLYVLAGYKLNGTKTPFDGTTFKAIYHDFDGDSSGDFGSELDLSLGKSFKLPENGQPFDKVNVLFKYADYNADDAPYTDTQKFWFQVSVNF